MWQAFIRLCAVSVLSMVMIQPVWAAQIARAQFSTDVVEREPIDDIGDSVKVEYGEIQRVYFFTDLRDMANHRVIHRWLLDGQVQAELAFDIGGDRWRVWSSKRLMPGFDGTWTVEIVDNGEVIDSRSFNYIDEY